MPRGVRNYTVQTPGESKPIDDQPGLEGVSPLVQALMDPDDADKAPDDADIRAQLAALQAENAKLRAGQAGVGRLEMEAGGKYARTHSKDVDMKSITAPVLCSDGWLVP